MPDCFQRTPKRICLQGEGAILALTVDGQGIHAVTRSAGGNKLSHRVYNIRDGLFGYDVPNDPFHSFHATSHTNKDAHFFSCLRTLYLIVPLPQHGQV